MVVADPREIPVAAIAPGAVAVGQYDYALQVGSRRLEAGRLDFLVTNNGAEAHELAIVERDGERYGEIVAEVEHIEPGDQRAVRVTLRPGTYSLVCLVIGLDADVPRAHMALGMESLIEVSR